MSRNGHGETASSAGTLRPAAWKPIIMDDHSIRQLRSGKKHQTRRPVGGVVQVIAPVDEERYQWTVLMTGPTGRLNLGTVKAPYGGIGTLLWIREAFGWGNEGIEFRADHPHPGGIKWKAPFYLRRAHSRIERVQTGIRLEPLQDITPDDARCEGVEGPDGGGEFHVCGDFWARTPVGSYRLWWDSLNKKIPWSSNPYVFVIEMEEIHS